MIRCRICKTDNVINTLFCRQCGTSLFNKVKRDTDPLDTEEVDWIEDTNNQRLTSPSDPTLTPLAVRLQIGVDKREVEMQLDKAILVGRLDPDTNCFPEIDLTEDTIQDKSVSRCHALIYKQDGQVFIEDVGSINGSFVNGQRLDSFIPKPLKNGDILQLGKVLIVVDLIAKSIIIISSCLITNL